MVVRRAWKYRIYPSRKHNKELNNYLNTCKNLWNSLLEYTKEYYDETKKFPSRKQLYLLSKDTNLYSQVGQNVADKLVKSLKVMIAKKKAGKKAGFPRFKSFDRMRSFTYPQFGFKLSDKLELSGLGSIMIKKHRNIQGQIKTLTIKKSPSRKWFAIFTSEVEIAEPQKKQKPKTGIDLGIEYFAYLSNDSKIENPRHLKRAELILKRLQQQLSRKKKGSKNRRKARLKVALSHEKVTNTRRDFLHKTSRKLVESFSFIAMENLNVLGLAKSFLAKHVLDCSWAEFLNMLHYKAAEAGSEIVLVNPAHTSAKCSSCGLVQKKSLAERWHDCVCGESMHRDLNAAKNILTRATHGQWESEAWGEDGNSFFYEPGSPESAKLTNCR
jgi:putative transposase